MTKELIILVGNIGSGKTTTCKELVKKGYIVVSRDALRYMMGSGQYVFNPEIEQAIAQSAYQIVENFMDADVKKVVVDEVNINWNLRDRYLYLADEYGYKKTAIVMPYLNQKDSVARRMKDPHGQFDKKVWESVYDRFDVCYQEPSFLEGFDKIKKLRKKK